MVGRRVGIGNQNGRQRGDGQLGQRRAPSPADRQLAGGQDVGQIVEEGDNGRRDAEFAVELPRCGQVGLARLMDDSPAAKGSTGLVDRPRNAFVQRSRRNCRRGSTVAKKKKLAQSGGFGMLPVLSGNTGETPAPPSRLHRTGLPVTRTGQRPAKAASLCGKLRRAAPRRRQATASPCPARRSAPAGSAARRVSRRRGRRGRWRIRPARPRRQPARREETALRPGSRRSSRRGRRRPRAVRAAAAGMAGRNTRNRRHRRSAVRIPCPRRQR